MVQHLGRIVALKFVIHTHKNLLDTVYVVVIKIVTNPSLVGQFDPHRNWGGNGDFNLIFLSKKKEKKSGTIQNKHAHTNEGMRL